MLIYEPTLDLADIYNLNFIKILKLIFFIKLRTLFTSFEKINIFYIMYGYNSPFFKIFKLTIKMFNISHWICKLFIKKI